MPLGNSLLNFFTSDLVFTTTSFEIGNALTNFSSALLNCVTTTCLISAATETGELTGLISGTFTASLVLTLGTRENPTLVAASRATFTDLP